MAIAEVANKRCGTCKERRVHCDRVLPSCSQCSASKIKCKGYALRLSWPNPYDSKRSRKGPLTRLPPACRNLAHVTFWDVQMHRYLTVDGHPRPSLHIPLMWNASELKQGSSELIQYFHSCASESLTTLGHHPVALGEALMRIALASTTPSASATINSLLALSSLHRYGVQTQAFRLKIATIKALAVAATTTDLTPQDIIQHAAAGMLLCAFEVHQASCTSSQWTWYISGVKEVLTSPCLSHLSRDSDLNALMDWVYYHDVMSRFTLRHWHGHVLEIPPKPAEMSSDKLDKVYTPVRPEINMKTPNLVTVADTSMLSNLELLTELSNAVTPHAHKDMSPEQLHDYVGYLRVLDWRVRSISTREKASTNSEHAIITELFKLATLVYLNRVTDNLLDQSENIDAHLDRAFHLFSKLGCCERQYPLFIIGCEARTDQQRSTVLDLIARTERKNSSRSLNHVKILVQALWAQADLADVEIDYSDKMSCVISSCTIIPSLV